MKRPESKRRTTYRPLPIWLTLAVLCPALQQQALADGGAVDKVYHPYVYQLEREIELRGVVQNDNDPMRDGTQTWRLGIGQSWTDRWYTEFYVIGEKVEGHDLSVRAWELEAKWQLTEQGEYWADWGLLFEFEADHDRDAWEASTAALVAKEWGRWTGMANLALIYEWGDDVTSEWETRAAAQLRYRWKPGLEPAVELYSGEDTKGLGPVFMGNVRAGGRRQLHWEIGVIFGLDSDSTDQTYRALVEFEF